MPPKRQHWSTAPLIELPEGKPLRPISMLHRSLPEQSIVPAHTHNWGQLVYAYRGVLDVYTNAGHYLLPPHRAVWIPPNIPHEISSLLGAEISSVYIVEAEAYLLARDCNVIEVSALLRELVIEALHQPTDYDWYGTTGRLFRTLRDQIATATKVPLHLPLPTDTRLLKICNALQKEPSSKRSLEQWSTEVGASSRTLQRLFLAQTGITFRRWRQQLRIQIALQRLHTSDDTVSNIAGDLGYDSTSAFIAMFQQHMGISPGEYLDALQQI